ncbi:uncharacterized protein LOC133299243 [Gastrolobium bilobum]|uniref:uncharacterized protein LOC133299243 n=1 Tax=Gastrolobium bilobum TaxID=150636 RepID=UPI002AB0D071|nr:uncharacterized protein LOC133299243 [Gastrolobium bilobum]
MDISEVSSTLLTHFQNLKVCDDRVLKCINVPLKSHSNKQESQKKDIYMIHRKEALEMMRSASQQFKSANEAYLRGEHLNAKQHSMKAREKLKMARELDCKAATEILNFKNRTNGLWRLDLHGLHAKEAVQALRERLEKIESVGKHSRGKPVLPLAVRSFLTENRYHFEDIRPGAIKVWPNFL